MAESGAAADLGFVGVAHQHRASHGPHTTWIRRQPARHLIDAWAKVSNLGVVDAVRAHVHDSRPRLDHVFGDQIGLARRGDEDVCTPGECREVLRARVADRHRGISFKQQQRRRFADDVAAADHHGARAFYTDAAAIEQLDDAGRRARLNASRETLFDQARIYRMNTIDGYYRVHRDHHLDQ